MKAERLLAHFERLADAPDAVPCLRRFILDLAVRGKLVEQDPTDEPASDLLGRIAPGNASRTQNGTLTPRSSRPEIEPDWPPLILPPGWVRTHLGSVIHLLSGQHLKPNEYSHDPGIGCPYVTGPADFGKDGLVVSRYTAVRRAIATNGQVLLTVKGAGVGKAVFCDIPEVAISRQLMAMTAIGWEQNFLMLVTHHLARTLKAKARSLIPGIGRADIDDFVFGLPPLAEQRRIVAKVDELIALCDRLEAAQAERESRRDRLVAASLHRLTQPADPPAFRGHALFHLRHFSRLTTRPEHVQELRQTILSLAVRGKLVPQDPTDEPARELFKRIQEHKARVTGHRNGRAAISRAIGAVEGAPFAVPDSWVWAPFGQLVISRDGERVPVSKEERNSRAKVYDYYGASGVIDKIDAYLFDKPLLLIGEDGANLINRSTPIAFVARGKYWVNNHAHVLDGISEDFLRYVELFINATDLKPYVTGTAQPKMNQAKMNSIPVALPPEKEQRRILTKMGELMALCDRLEDQLATARRESHRLLEAVLHEALAPTG